MTVTEKKYVAVLLLTYEHVVAPQAILEANHISQSNI
jgi:hypothetical protein